MFGYKTDAELVRLTAEIAKLSREVAELSGEKEALDKARILTDDLYRLQEQLETLKIEKLRIVEENERDAREIMHKVGLERKTQEFEAEQHMEEIEVAKREALVEVREDNLSSEREAFEKQMSFITERFTQETDYLREIMDSIMQRLPDVNMEIVKNGTADNS